MGPSLLFPASLDPPADDHSWHAHNARATAALFRCLERADCAQNQTKVVILPGWHFRAVLDGYLGGEGIWARSTVIALHRLGYTYLYTDGGVDPMVRLYRIFAPLVRAVVVDAPDAHACFRDQYCALRRDWAWGIPIWKILSFHFWAYVDHPLGRKWTLSPEPYLPAPDNNTYLGYSVQPSCTQQPSSRMTSATRPGSRYTSTPRRQTTSPRRSAHSRRTSLRACPLRSASLRRGRAGADSTLPAGVTNLGGMDPARFYEAVAKSWVLMGIGAPSTSPTPYDALCLGVPFINPILTWDPARPDDRSKWEAQHEALKHFNPPHVYNVFKDDEDGLERAVRAALDAPILDRYILPRMELGAVQARVGAILETDWRSAAEAVLAARVKAAAEKGPQSGEETEDKVSTQLAWFGLSSRGVDNGQMLFWIGP
ncbi:hypothetical protein B0H13DRAFT_1597860 [Mycena leptocephala]|nr:hypothetical protein B0H13DRAFT_1597860 [Mycena leptocephala]